MTPKPDWLSVFPFLDSQWSSIASLLESCHDLAEYHVVEDWQDFESSHPYLDDFARLRQFRKSRMAYLAYLDFQLPLNQHVQTMQQITALADHLIQQAFQLAGKEMLSKFGQVKDRVGNRVNFHVFALGKLGTNELNFSSDVDLVFVYDGPGVSDGNRALDAEAYFTRLGQKIIKLLDHYTTDGLVYRVDMRLRPFGSAGPLVCSFNSMSQYLIHEGRDWERFAWMRARHIIGATESAQKIRQEISPFVYRKHLDYSVFESLAGIKKEMSLTHHEHQNDLKHGPGGIRVIEFIVQSLQLVFGGRITHLQGVSIYPRFSQLKQEQKLSDEDAELLSDTWMWLRKLENMLQMVNDTDTHCIPENSLLLNTIAQLWGFSQWQSMNEQLQSKLLSTHEVFGHLFSEVQSSDELSQDDHWSLQKLLQQLSLQKVPRESVQKIEQLLTLTLQKSSPDVAEDFVVLVKAILKRPNYLLMLLKEHNVHQNVLNLLATDGYFKAVLTQYPVLLEQLFEHQPFKVMTAQSLSQQWSEAVVEEDDLEQWMEGLRYFKLVQQFNLMRAVSAGEISPSSVGAQLTQLAGFILQQVVQYSWQETELKLGQGHLKLDTLMVIAYGSMAVNAMSLTSDLDLVFVLDQSTVSADDRLFVQRWIKRILHHLSSSMYHGQLYEIDLQLRPNGQSGTLVTTAKEFAKYQQNEAWTWEHAAMVKSKLVVGTEAQKSWHQSLRNHILTQPRSAEKVDKDLDEMAAKLRQIKSESKHNNDLKLLGAVLKYSNQYPELLACDDMDELERRLVELSLNTVSD